LAEALAQRGVATFLHEWRGHGSSSLRAGRGTDWGYRELLALDLAASEAAMAEVLPDPGIRRAIGGHSLGGQLAACRLAMSPGSAQELWLVASGAPWWRAFPRPLRYGLPLAYRFLPWLARRYGALPGRRIGFGGNEARGVIADWARTALGGRYAAAGLDVDLEAGLAAMTHEVRALVMDDDWLAPASSLRFLLTKMPGTSVSPLELDAQALGTRADHFAWMNRPAAVAVALAD
jgi:predicted alpha/beta hydrolase